MTPGLFNTDGGNSVCPLSLLPAAYFPDLTAFTGGSGNSNGVNGTVTLRHLPERRGGDSEVASVNIAVSIGFDDEDVGRSCPERIGLPGNTVSSVSRLPH
jgi:hypothetical protein